MAWERKSWVTKSQILTRFLLQSHLGSWSSLSSEKSLIPTDRLRHQTVSLFSFFWNMARLSHPIASCQWKFLPSGWDLLCLRIKESIVHMITGTSKAKWKNICYLSCSNWCLNFRCLASCYDRRNNYLGPEENREHGFMSRLLGYLYHWQDHGFVFYLQNHRIIDSQNVRGWKGPLGVI